MLWASLLTLRGANPAFQDFNTNQFGTAGNKVAVKSGVLLTNVIADKVTVNDDVLLVQSPAEFQVTGAHGTGRFMVSDSAGVQAYSPNMVLSGGSNGTNLNLAGVHSANGGDFTNSLKFRSGATAGFAARAADILGSIEWSTNFSELSVTNLTIINNVTVKNGGTLNLAGGSLSGDAYVIVGGSSIALTNGLNLLSAYTAAKTKTPHGSALAAANRYTIFLSPGVYDLGSASLTLDTQFIDIVGISDNTGAVKSSNAGSATDQGDTIVTSTGTPVNVTAASQDIALVNLCLKTTTSGTDATLSTSQTGFGVAFKVINVLLCYAGSGNRITQWDKNFNGYWQDVRAFSSAGAGNRAFGASVASGITINGTFIRCKADTTAWGGENSVSVTLSGVFIDCEGGSSSFAGAGSGTKTLSGTFLRCRPGNSSGAMFGGTDGTLSGTFDSCEAPLSVSAWGSTMSGVMRNCAGSAPVSWSSVTGTVIGCNWVGWNGPLAVNTADSSSIANTTTESNFSLTKSLPIQVWKIGRAFKWEAWGKVATDGATPGTLTLKFKFGTNIVNNSGALTMLAGITNKGWTASGLFVARTLGSSGTFSAQMKTLLDSTASAAVSVVPSAGVVTNSTTAAITAQMSATWSVADADNAIVMENFVLWPLDANN